MRAARGKPRAMNSTPSSKTRQANSHPPAASSGASDLSALAQSLAGDDSAWALLALAERHRLDPSLTSAALLAIGTAMHGEVRPAMSWMDDVAMDTPWPLDTLRGALASLQDPEGAMETGMPQLGSDATAGRGSWSDSPRMGLDALRRLVEATAKEITAGLTKRLADHPDAIEPLSLAMRRTPDSPDAERLVSALRQLMMDSMDHRTVAAAEQGLGIMNQPASLTPLPRVDAPEGRRVA